MRNDGASPQLSPATGCAFPSIVRALVFDVDGTLYDQRSLRVRMAWSLARAMCSDPRKQMRVMRFLKAYREAQEYLRGNTAPERNLAKRQLEEACAKSGTSQSDAMEYLQHWFCCVPLNHLSRMANEDVANFLKQAKSSGLRLGVLSDYPAKQKLNALGLGGLFDVIICSSDPDIGRFKPSPAGLQRTLQRLNVHADEAIYIGDRPDVDAACAEAAGVHAVIVDQPPSSFRELRLRFQQERIFA